MKELLNRLQKADPATYNTINDISKCYDGFPIAENPNYRVMEHVVQGEVQKAIVARGWLFGIDSLQNPENYFVSICKGGLKVEPKVDGRTACIALLECYLKALEAQ